MNNQQLTEEDFEKISAWLLKEMDEPTRLSFEQEIASNPKLREYADELKWLKEGIGDVGRKEKIEEWHKAAFGGNQAPVKRMGLRWAWISSAAIVLLVAGFWLYSSSKNNLYSAYYSPDPGLITPMGATDAYAFQRGMVDYKTGRYEAALARWNTLRDSAPSDTLQYFTGCAQLALDQPKPAYESFLPVLNNAGSAFHHEARWYAALAQLKLGDKKQAIQLLEQCRYPDAPALLKALREN